MDAREAFLKSERARRCRQQQQIQSIVEFIKDACEDGHTRVRVLEDWRRSGALDRFMTEHPSFGLTCACFHRRWFHSHVFCQDEYISWAHESDSDKAQNGSV